MAHALRETVEEIAIWVAAVLLFVGLPGLIGYLVADGTGLLVGAVGGALVLGIVWVVLLVKSVSLAAALLRRRR